MAEEPVGWWPFAPEKTEPDKTPCGPSDRQTSLLRVAMPEAPEAPEGEPSQELQQQ